MSAFPTIGPAECRDYIRTARLTPNAVALRIHHMLTPAHPTMEQRCMWCNRLLGIIACAPDQAGKVSHGTCLPCVEKHWGITFTAADATPAGVAGAGAGLGGGDSTFDCRGVRPIAAKDSHEGALGLRPSNNIYPASS